MAKKNTLWFPHDYNARADEKTAALISDHGAAGYGIYNIITEMLHESEDSMIEYSEKKLRRLATSCKITYEYLKVIIDDCIHVYELLVMSDNNFYSNRVIRNKHDREL
ncbi:MAG: Lin1244/Lin1753 domain-containing protein, partial [Pseudomonadota bacterium]